MQNVWFKWRTRDTCESTVVIVSFAEGIATASSNAVEIRLQELRGSSVTRGREWLQGALEEISALELRKMVCKGVCV